MMRTSPNIIFIFADTQMELESRLQKRLAELGDEFLEGRIYLERDGLTHHKATSQSCSQHWVNPWQGIDTVILKKN